MMETWRTIRLGSACTTNSATYSPKEKWEFVNYLDTGNITNNCIDSIQYIDIESEKLPSRARRKVKTNSIIYSTVRPNQRHFGIIKSQPDNFLVSTGFAVIDVKPEILDADYLYYVLTQDSIVEKLHAIAEQSTSAYPSIKSSDIEDLEIEVPDLATQKKIADILGELDRKAKQNAEINKNLYQQLFALYDYYCDSADDGEIELGALCQFQEGYVNPAQTHPEYFDGDVKWLRAVDINESFIIETSRTLTQTGFQSAKKSAYLFSPNTIAISKSGTIGRLGIVGDYMCGNRAVINIAPKDPLLLPYIYAFLKSHQKQFPDLAVGSVQKNLYVSLLEPLPVRILAPDSLSEFCNAGNAILNAVYNNCQENIRLAQLRDTLLPRLMTGELDVSRLTL